MSYEDELESWEFIYKIWIFEWINPLSDSSAFFLAPSLLQQISSLRMADSNEDSSIQLSMEPEKKAARSGLIEVISSTESDQSQPQQPRHHLTVCPDSNGSTRSLKLSVELPGVRSVSQCQLSISQVSVPVGKLCGGKFSFPNKCLYFILYIMFHYQVFCNSVGAKSNFP